MVKLNTNKIGLSFGLCLAVLHLVWSFFVGVIPNALQSFIDWVFVLHSIQPLYIIMPFSFWNTVLLVIITFVFGYIIGFVFATLHNLLKH
jgi:hypothetical protein